MSSGSNDNYLEQVKAEIRADAELARARDPLPRRDPPPAAPRAANVDGIERERLDYLIGELTGAHYSAFLDMAFRALLKRAPDDAGSTTQVRLLAAGASKAEILGNLRWSPEGKRVGARVRGLLPRYALAKLARIPVLGYGVEWGIALAGLPVLMRHQRAADTSVAAHFTATEDAHREHAGRLQELGSRVAALPANVDQTLAEFHVILDQRLAQIGTAIQGALQQLHSLKERTIAMESRSHAVAEADGQRASELAELRHSVHTTNHWVVSLQRNLGAIEDAAHARHARADQLVVASHEFSNTSAARHDRDAAWASALASALPNASIVLDLGSGDGTWLEALRACGVAVRGVENNSVWVERAQARGSQVALGDPMETLARCPDASLGGIVLAAAALATSNIAIAELLAHAQRSLRRDGCLLLRLEGDAPGLLPASAASLDPLHWERILRGAGFTQIGELANGGVGATALLGRRA